MENPGKFIGIFLETEWCKYLASFVYKAKILFGKFSQIDISKIRWWRWFFDYKQQKPSNFFGQMWDFLIGKYLFNKRWVPNRRPGWKFFEILISGVYLIRLPGWKKFPKINSSPGPQLGSEEYVSHVVAKLVGNLHNNTFCIGWPCSTYTSILPCCYNSIEKSIMFCWHGWKTVLPTLLLC